MKVDCLDDFVDHVRHAKGSMIRFVLSEKMVTEDGKHGFSSDGESRNKIPNHYIKNGCFTKHPLKMVV